MRTSSRFASAVLVSATSALALASGARSDTSGTAAQVRAGVPGPPVVAAAVRHDTSRPLREVPAAVPQARPPRQVPNRVPPDLLLRSKPFTKGPDAVAQTVLGPTETPAPLAVIEGQSDDENSATLGFRIVPPDTNGDVGPNHYVQFINLILSVYDTRTGERVFGPVAGNSIWTGFGGICEDNNDGDTIVLYDHLADRWVLSQFALGQDGYQCVAVSTSGDPAGSYHRYAFNVSPGAMNDYPKLGVWPDGYYMTVNEFQGTFAGAVAVVFEREKMLGGLEARMVRMGPLECGDECFFSLQPSDLDGPAPPDGTPNTFVMAFDDETWGTGNGPDGYRLWDFAVSWENPPASTFTSLGQVDASEFDAKLCGYARCVPQPDGELLDTLASFTMYRAAYRRFEGYDAMVVSHTVDATGKNLAGVRWAELRKYGSGWYLHQQGTIAPDDGHHRWMSSAAIDAAGNIAIGYSVSSRNMFPSIRYTVHMAGDAPGLVGSEVTLHEGTGSQERSYSRWGDYSSMSVAPDGKTFWYTQEYYAATGRFDFNTTIGAFRVKSTGRRR